MVGTSNLHRFLKHMAIDFRGSLEQPKIRPELRQLAKVVEPEATEVLEFLSLAAEHWVQRVNHGGWPLCTMYTYIYICIYVYIYI